MPTTDTMTNVRMRKSGRQAVNDIPATLDNLASTIRGQARRPQRHDAGVNDTLDTDALRSLVALREAVEATIADAVAYLRDEEYSWSEIADGLGVSKQAAAKRYGALDLGPEVTFRRVGGAS